MKDAPTKLYYTVPVVLLDMTRKKFRIQLGFKPNTFRIPVTRLPLGHLDPWQRSRRHVTLAALPRGLSQIPTNSLSELDGTGTWAEVCNVLSNIKLLK